ncbi:MAG TPA: nitroreductase family deazaflavin-dependent oxidoreductase [Myxococcota bacterium]|jgi:deazaflavin-dependent oxidoreductase (nitroreductase family)|nr:nitroreductase family deazaflavin-dependent oxidoreductase [Myxococcota bacterium]
MNLPRFLRQVNRVFTNPLMRTFAWRVPPLAVVHHVGRKSGRAYRTPVVAFPSGKGFVIPMTYGRDVDWARNLVAARGGEVEQRGERVALGNPRIVDFDAAEKSLPPALRGIFRAMDLPGYVLLERRGSAGKRAAGKT